MEPLDILRKYWSYDSFRPFQREIIDSILKGRDTLAILPTGGGKSICFQVPAMINEGICLVVSPLISLMKDQVENLKSRGIKAMATHSGMNSYEIDVALDNAVFGNYKFLYLSPERLGSDMFRARVANMNISLLVVDEAHCISQWGYDFRPDYLKIREVIDLLDGVPVIALTATATPQVAEDIMDKLGFRAKNIIQGSFRRENLVYMAKSCEDKNGQLLKIIKSVKGCGIVYVRERKRAEEVAAFLQSQNISAEPYHAGHSSQLRSERQDGWRSDSIRIIVATSAFGMGIDKPDVRFVVHFDMPDSVEAYYQEAGRGGRDGLDSYAVLLWNNSDIKRLKQIISASFPDSEYVAEVYQKVFKYLNLAYGSGKGAAIRFNLTDFAKQYKLYSVSAYYAIKSLESEGYMELTEEVDNPTRIQFLVNRDELYGVQLKNANMDSFIKSLLRLYEGLFSNYIAIDEEYIARATRNSTAAVNSMLLQLSRMRVLGYIPGAKSPLLILNEERLDEKNLYLSEEERSFRKDAHIKRVDSIIGYASESRLCRSVSLLDYFGEKKSEECGKCDLCLGREHMRNIGSYESALEKRLIEILSESPRTLAELGILIEDENEIYLDILREMADIGEVKVEGDKVTMIRR